MCRGERCRGGPVCMISLTLDMPALLDWIRSGVPGTKVGRALAGERGLTIWRLAALRDRVYHVSLSAVTCLLGDRQHSMYVEN
jgi:hypothetical protein